jgi:hypothetical protein
VACAEDRHTIRRINRFGNWFADRALRAIAAPAHPGHAVGFRVYPVSATLSAAARRGPLRLRDEISLRAARSGLPVIGVPVEVHYPPVAERVSHYRADATRSASFARFSACSEPGLTGPCSRSRGFG